MEQGQGRPRSSMSSKFKKTFRFKTVKTAKVHEPILTESDRDELGGYEYPWHNIVFEGGGNKGLAYCGAVRVLEEIGIWSQVKRIAGTSAGAMTAGLLAVGYDSHDLEAFLKQPELEHIFLAKLQHKGLAMDYELPIEVLNPPIYPRRYPFILLGGEAIVVQDAPFGIFSLLPNMMKRFGWHPGNRLYSWFGKMMYKKTGNADITFEEVYKMYGKELCICVTNLNFLDCNYCHVKTTPDLPVRMAMRMSGSIPGVFCTVKNTLSSFPDHYIDGGLLVNYPIHAFDGWYLSMRPENTFLRKLQPLKDIRKLWDRKERFQHKNERTLGMLLYSDFEPEVMKDALNERHSYYQDYVQATPATKLAKKRSKKVNNDYIEAQHNSLVDAMDKLLAELNKHDLDQDGNITMDEWKKTFNNEDSKFTCAHKKMLFGEDGLDPEKIFTQLDFDKNGTLSFRELVYWAETRGLKLLSAFRGYERREIKSMMDFFSTLMECLLLNMKRVFIQDNDLFRTVGIDCKYLDAMDFKMEPEDQEFLIQQGKLGCMSYLREFVDKFQPSSRRKNQVNRDSLQRHRVTMEFSRLLNSESDGEGMVSPTPPVLENVHEEDVFSKQMREATPAQATKVSPASKVNNGGAAACSKRVTIALPDDYKDGDASAASCEDVQLIQEASTAM